MFEKLWVGAKVLVVLFICFFSHHPPGKPMNEQGWITRRLLNLLALLLAAYKVVFQICLKSHFFSVVISGEAHWRSNRGRTTVSWTHTRCWIYFFPPSWWGGKKVLAVLETNTDNKTTRRGACDRRVPLNRSFIRLLGTSAMRWRGGLAGPEDKGKDRSCRRTTGNLSTSHVKPDESLRKCFFFLS